MKIKKHITAASVTAAAVLMNLTAALPKSAELIVPLTASASSTVNNPVIWADVPDSDVIRVGDTYYMVSTTMFFSPGAPIMKSKDMVSWEICNYVYDTLADGDVQNLTNGKHDYSHGQWAASLRYHDGTYYVFFGSYGTGKSYIFKTDDIEKGKWTRSEINGMYHDASILFDDDGRNYLVYGSGEIKIKELNSDMTGFKQGGVDKTLFKTNISGYVAGEGSHIQKIGDYYYIFIIAWPSGSGRTEYCYRSKDLLGTYESKAVLSSGLGSYGSGVAQGGIVDTPDGKWYGMLFQDHGSVGRIPVLVPVTWQNDWPIMGVNGKAPVTLNIDGDYTGTTLAVSDDFSYNSNDLKLEWQWNHNPDNSSWSVTDRDGWLRLYNSNKASDITGARNTLTMRTEGPGCSSVIKMDTSGMKPGDHAGLSAFQFNYGNIGVYSDSSGNKKVYMAKNGGYTGNSEITDSRENILDEVPLKSDEIYLKAEFRFSDVKSDMSASNDIDKANFFYSYDGSSWTKLGEELKMTYDLKMFTGYRSAIYSYPTIAAGGHTDIDFFDYQRDSWNTATVVEADANGYYFHDTFEGKNPDWTGRGNASVSLTSDVAYEGNSSMKVTERGATWHGAIKPLGSAFKAGETYSFSTDVMFDKGADSQLFHFTMQYNDSNNDPHYVKIASGTALKDTWMQLVNTDFTIPEDASEICIYVETEDDAIDFFIDDVIGAKAGTVIEGAGKGPVIIPGDVNCDGKINAFDVVAARKGIIKGYSDAYAAVAADADKDGKPDINDVVLINEFVLGKITEFPVYSPPEPEKPEFIYDSALKYHAAPNNYLDSCSQAGKIVKESYTGINGNKQLNVYLPYGYDSSKKYNIFYLMHGGSENENTIFSNDVKLQNILDYMIMNGELEPLIVVTPTFNGCPAPDNNMGAGTVWDEMRQSIIPFVEKKYSTYAESTSEADLKASRYHRAYGGFSMGGGSTWNMFINNLDICAYYMPLSGHCWSGAEGIQNAIDKFGYNKDEYFVFAATGDKDLAYNNMLGLINPLKQDTKHFTYTSDFSKGNLYFMVANGPDHWWGYVRHYVYDALPYFFHED